MSNGRQSLFFAFQLHAAGVPVAAGVSVLLSPILAAAAMTLSSVSVIRNALRQGGTSTPPRRVLGEGWGA